MRFLLISVQKVIPFLLIMLILLLAFSIAFTFADGVKFKTCETDDCGKAEL
jgi:hypothetical protein